MNDFRSTGFRNLKRGALVAVLFTATQLPLLHAADVEVKMVEMPPTTSANSFYINNREPLAASPMVKLPIGSITPRGWLRHQLELQADGMVGHLPELSHWCKFDGNAWTSPDGQGENAWEEVPYWLKGFGDLGYVLKDERIINEARKWVDAVLASQESDGYFGPRANKTGLEGKPDLWPHMVMCNVLQTYYEFSNDERVLPFLTKYFRWLDSLPGSTFGNGLWPRVRAGDAIETAYWLYNRTGDTFLLNVAKKIHDNMARWDQRIIDHHNVNIAQGFREPGVYYLQARDKKYLNQPELNYHEVMGIWGQFPGGGFAADENCRPGYIDPRQGFETCGIVEFMHSFEMLTKISGNPVWADRCEEIAFNSFPASMMPDLKGLHYLTCPNQVQLDRGNKSPAIQNHGNMFSYSPSEAYRCCQHNVSHGWPYYAEELWLATLDGGLCASLYSASEVAAKVGGGETVKIAEESDYPFSDTITFKVASEKPADFPLYLRVPRWCDNVSVKVNGKSVKLKAKPLSYIALKRIWKNGDVVTLKLPMRIKVRTWAKNQNSVSVDYGPLTFSLKIGERWSRCGGSDRWPDYEVYPTTPWNYGLVLDEKSPAKSFEIVRKSGPLPEQPFDSATTPIELRVNARRIPSWQTDWQGLITKLQPSPVKSDQPLERVTLIPMGAARLRISSFPVIGNGPNATVWKLPPPAPVSASHCFPSDTVDALVDGKVPGSSNDQTIPRFTWWDHVGTREWVQYDWDTPKTVAGVEVYWFDDSGRGSCRVPSAWKLFYKSGDGWKEVEGASGYGTKTDTFNRIRFQPVQTTALRLEAQLQPKFSGGILEWRVNEK